jgi:hypothetical protein
MTRNEDRCLAQVRRFADRHNSKTRDQLRRLRQKQDFFNTINLQRSFGFRIWLPVQPIELQRIKVC